MGKGTILVADDDRGIRTVLDQALGRAGYEVRSTGNAATLWRWLSADALRPWQHRSWIVPRDPDFGGKAGRILDLYARLWQGRPLGSSEFVISADEKSSIQARRRKQPTLPAAAGRTMRVEHEYFREGAWTYLAAWDVHRAKIFGHCEKKGGIAPTHRLIADVMRREPYKSAKRVFWIMDNCSAHRGQKAVERIAAACRTHNKTLGYLALDVEDGKAMLSRGFRMLAYGGDLWLYQQALRAGIAAIRGSMKEGTT